MAQQTSAAQQPRGNFNNSGTNNSNSREQIEKFNHDRQMNLKTLLLNALPSVSKVVSNRLDPERLARVFLAAVSRKPALLACTPDSFRNAFMQAATVGLEPETPLGHAYLVPYDNKYTNEKEAVFQISYRGLILIATRSGTVASATACIVYQNEKFKVMRGTDEKIEHEPIFDETKRGAFKVVYAVVTLKNGYKKFDVMTFREIEDIRKRAASSKSKSPWNTDWEEMAKKTVFRRVLKTVPIENEKLAQIINFPAPGSMESQGDFDPPVMDGLATTSFPVEQSSEPVDAQPDEQRAPETSAPAQPVQPAQPVAPAISPPVAQQPAAQRQSPPRNGTLFGNQDREPGSDG
jgi:recombination protein RecT